MRIKSTLIIILIFISNCFITYSYEKNLKPSEEEDHFFKEISMPEKPLLGTAQNNSQKVITSFPGILKGANRYLILESVKNEQSIKIELKESSIPLQGEQSAILYFKNNKIFNKINRVVSVKDLEIKNQSSQEYYYAFLMYPTGDINYVELRKSNEDDNYIKQFVPESSYSNGSEIRWKERNKIKRKFIWGLFYSGYVITYPLDIITFPFQAAFYMMSGGVK